MKTRLNLLKEIYNNFTWKLTRKETILERRGHFMTMSETMSFSRWSQLTRQELNILPVVSLPRIMA
jgi:hypothetical protein